MLNIIISGTAGTGKSTISTLIAKTLEEHGFDVSVNLLDGLTVDDITHLDERLARIKDRSGITVTETQTSRASIE